MDTLAAGAAKKPITPLGLYNFYCGRTKNLAVANLMFSITALINNAVSTVDKVNYEPMPLYFVGCWGGGLIFITSILATLFAEPGKLKQFKLYMFLMVLCVPCAGLMCGMGIWGMIYDIGETASSGINRPMDIIIAICGLFSFICCIIACHAAGEALKAPADCWFKEKKLGVSTHGDMTFAQAEYKDAENRSVAVRSEAPVNPAFTRVAHTTPHGHTNTALTMEDERPVYQEARL